MPILKNPRWEIFAQEMAKGSTADAAHTKAGYKESRHNAHRLSTNQHIRDRITEIQGRAAERAAVSVDRIVQEMSRLAFSDLTQMVQISKTGRVKVKSTDEIPEDLRAAIASIKKTKGGSLEVKFYDKSKALDMLARHAGMFKERIDIHVGVSLVDLVLGSYPQPEAPKQIEGKVIDAAE